MHSLLWKILPFMLFLGSPSFLDLSASQSSSSDGASQSSVSLNSTYTIEGGDYEEQTSLVQILTSPNGTFLLKFGSLPGQSNPHSLGIVYTASSSTLIWYTYRDNNPGLYDNLGASATSLSFTETGDLTISVDDAHGIMGEQLIIWSTKTSGLGVQSMELRESGNLVLLNRSGGIVWQSFDHPTEVLVPSQRLAVGSNLLTMARNGYPSTGMTMLAMESERLVSYVKYVEQEPYWELSPTVNTNTTSSSNPTSLAYAAIVNRSIALFDGHGEIVATIGNMSDASASQVLQRFNLDSDGNMRLYGFDNATSAWTIQMQVITGACELPDDCGFYGMCIPGQGCGCPPTFGLLATLNGCVPPRGLVCESKYGSEFVKVPAASYFSLGSSLDSNLTTFTAMGISQHSCKSICVGNCGCLGFFYGESNGACLITEQLRTFTASIDGNYTQKYVYDLYVRVQGKPSFPLAIVLGTCIPVGLILFLVSLWWFVRCRVRVAHAEEEEFLLGALPGLPPRYSYGELKTATKNFTQRIGHGSFGSVYEGTLEDGSRIAVKQLEGVMQGKKEFHAEIATIGTVRHVNLVCLKGFCLDRIHRLLVYEHMARGSLDGLLFPTSGNSDNGIIKEKTSTLTLKERLTIAIGVAKALTYLHEGSPECIIHCDIKPENVLVSDEGEAKLSDFGLAKMMNRKKRDSSETIVRGTRGYMAPEWLRGIVSITEKADVYSYGVLLLEILSGRRNYEAPSNSSTSRYVPGWALRNLSLQGSESIERKLLDEAIMTDVDHIRNDSNSVDNKDLKEDNNKNNNKERVHRAFLTALWCVQEDPDTRPSMSRVVKMLEGDVDIPTPPGESVDDDTFSTSSFLVVGAADATSSTKLKSAKTDNRFYITSQSEVSLPFFARASRIFSTLYKPSSSVN